MLRLAQSTFMVYIVNDLNFHLLIVYLLSFSVGSGHIIGSKTSRSGQVSMLKTWGHILETFLRHFPKMSDDLGIPTFPILDGFLCVSKEVLF